MEIQNICIQPEKHSIEIETKLMFNGNIEYKESSENIEYKSSYKIDVQTLQQDGLNSYTNSGKNQIQTLIMRKTKFEC